MTHYKVAKLRWREISSTLEKFKSYIFFAHLGDKECATELQCHPSEKNPFWVLQNEPLFPEPLFHSDTHVSFPKANRTYHETFHSIPGAANSLPDMKKRTVLKGGTAVTAIQVPWLSFQPHSKPREIPEKGSRQNPFSLTQQFYLSRVFSFYYLTLSHIAPMMYGRASMFTSLFRWGKTGPICKTRHFNWLGEVTEIISCG